MPDWQSLRSGPLELYFADGELRRIRMGEREILRRVYVAVRDQNWDTVSARIENLQVTVSALHFAITYDAIHRQDSIDFRWRATITGTEAGRITFALDGKAHSTFLRNRIGFCVHHPLRECAGQPCSILHADGTRETGTFPELVAPHQPFLNIAAISHQVRPGLQAELRFHGESFEMEDHRNWTDANFKTYGTPLRLPFPVSVPTGTEIHQLIELALRGPADSATRVMDEPTRVRIVNAPAMPLPRLGLSIPAGSPAPSTSEISRLALLRLNHLRVDLSLAQDPTPALQSAISLAAALKTGLEAAITIPGSLAPLKPFAAQIRQWLVYHRGEKSSSEQTMRSVRQALGPDAVLAAGTDAYFAELNRNRPLGDEHNTLCFSINPQVHAFDDESVMENAAAQGDVIRTARSFAQGRSITVSPVTLRPRSNPNATTATAPPPPDPRQKLPFCAAWTLASLQALAQAGTASVTYYQTHGPAGVLDGDTTFPVFETFRALAGFAGGTAIPTESSAPLRVASLLLAAGKRRRLMLANLTGAPQSVVADHQPGPIQLAPYALRTFDWDTP